MEYKKYNLNSFNLYAIKTNKFKNIHLEIVFRNNIIKEEILLRKFLIDMLTYSNKKYPSSRKLNIALEELYDTNFYSMISRVGGMIITSFCFDFINPKYVNDNYLLKVLELSKDIIYDVNLDDKDIFNLIKENIKNDIKVSKDNNIAYAYKQLFKNMDDKSFISYDMTGNIKDLEKIDLESISNIYQKMIDEDYCDIYIIGDIDVKKVKDYYEDNFINRTIKTHDITLYSSINKRRSIKLVKENKDINQANLLVGCNILSKNKDIVGYIYNYILGGSSLDTKLANSLREDNSLCYTVNSIYQKYDQLIIIYAGIDSKNLNKCIKLIKKELKNMINNITIEELDNAKKNIKTSLNMIYDNQNSLINNYLFNNIANLKTIEDRIKEVDNITLNDIKDFAKQVKINTIYMLGKVK